jgi:hypothetical protein
MPERTKPVAPPPTDTQSIKVWLASLRTSFGDSWLDSFAVANPRGGLRPKPKLLKPRKERVCFVVRVDLDNAKPPIWRRLRLASDLKLDELHLIVQVAMGWTDSHLHQFKMGPDAKDFMMEPFLTEFDLQEGAIDGILESEVRLDEVVAIPGHRLFYEYDFGDGWHHTVKLEKVEPWRDADRLAVCIGGRRACPPENVGGPGGYGAVLAGLAGEVDLNEQPWLVDQLDALPSDFDPAAFDVAEVNELLGYRNRPLGGRVGPTDGLISG